MGLEVRHAGKRPAISRLRGVRSIDLIDAPMCGCIMPVMASSGQGSERLNAQLLVDSIPALIHTARPDGYLDYFNKPWLEYLGVTLDKVAGWNWTAFVHPEDVEGIVAKWRACLATGGIFEYETRVRSANGEYRWMFHRKVPLRDANGNIVKWYGSSLDIDERKTAEEHLRRHAEELQRSEFYLAEGQRLAHMGSWAFDPDGFYYWSPELFRMHGLDPASKPPSVREYLDCVHPQDRESMANLIKGILAKASPFDATKRIVRPNGEVRYIRCVSAPVVENQSLKKYVGSAIDVTEHELLTQDLRRREAYLAEAQSLSHTGSFGWKPATGEIVWSDETYRIFEYDRVKKPTMDMVSQRVHTEDRAHFQKVIEGASGGTTHFEHTYRLLLPDGRIKYVRALAEAFQDASGNLEFVGAVSDVSEQRHAEAVIRAQEAELREVLDSIPAIVWSTLPDGSNTKVTKRFVEYSGSSAEQTAGSGWQALIHPDDLERHADKWMEAVATGKPHEIEVRSRRSDGQYRWQLDRGVPLRDEDGNIVKWYGVTTDIEDRKRAEEALELVSRDLQESKTRLEEAQRIAHVGHWAWDGNDGLTWSDETYRIYGLRPQERPMTVEAFQEMIHPEDREILFRAIQEARDGGFPDIEYRIIHPSGEVRIVHAVTRDVSGQPYQMFGIVQDITDRKRAEEALEALSRDLQDSKAKLEEAQRITHVGYWELDLETNRVTWSDETYRIHGLQPQERPMDLAAVREKIHPEDWDIVFRALEEALSSGARYNVECRVFRPTGEVRVVHSQGDVKRDASGRPTLTFGTIQDITDRKRAEEALQQSQFYLAEGQRLAHM